VLSQNEGSPKKNLEKTVDYPFAFYYIINTFINHISLGLIRRLVIIMKKYSYYGGVNQEGSYTFDGIAEKSLILQFIKIRLLQ
jgi:hypothetical protein